jgi:hypothetical protein
MPGWSDINPTLSMGFMLGSEIGTLVTSGSSTCVSFPFYAVGSGGDVTVSSISIYIVAITGSPVFSLYVADSVYSSTGNPPATAYYLATRNSWAPTSTGWVDDINSQLSWSDALATGYRYHFVMQNISSNPSSNYIRLAYHDINFVMNQTMANGYLTASALTGSWTLHSRHLGGFKITFNNGSSFGFQSPSSAGYNLINMYGTSRLGGFKFSLPSGLNYNVVALSFYCPRTGNGCSLASRIYSVSNNQLLATSVNKYTWQQNYQATQIRKFFFSSPVTLSGGTEYRAVVFDVDNVGSSSNYMSHYCLLARNSTEQSSFGMSVTGTYSTNGGSTWTDDTSVNLVPMVFLIHLDPSNPFSVPSGSGGSGGGGGGGGGGTPSRVRSIFRGVR